MLLVGLSRSIYTRLYIFKDGPSSVYGNNRPSISDRTLCTEFIGKSIFCVFFSPACFSPKNICVRLVSKPNQHTL
jgi:hypothetical protein